jgi:hypothetical protein
MCSSPDGFARCRLAVLCCAVSSTPSTLDGCLKFLRSPIRDAVETRGEKTTAVLAAIRYIYIYIYICVLGKNVELLRVSNRS